MGKKSRRQERQKKDDKPVPLEHRLMDQHVGHLVYYNDAPNDLYPETYTFGEGTPDWMYRVPPFRMLDPGDHMMDRYIKHAKTWAEAAKAGAADVE